MRGLRETCSIAVPEPRIRGRNALLLPRLLEFPDDLPAPPLGREDAHDERLVRDFRRLARRLGEIEVAVLDVRLAGGETKLLVGNPALGSPGKYVIKRVVQQVKELAREYAASLGDPELLRRVERAMASEEETVAKRRSAMAARQVVGA